MQFEEEHYQAISNIISAVTFIRVFIIDTDNFDETLNLKEGKQLKIVVYNHKGVLTEVEYPMT
jgi:hypothetical protein